MTASNLLITTRDAPVDPANTEILAAQPDTLHFLDQVEEQVEEALHSLKNGRSWKTADHLELAVQRIRLHRRLIARTGAGSTLPL